MMTFRRATVDRLAARLHLTRRCSRLPPMYRYVAAASVACMICIAHLLVNQAFLPAQSTDTITAGRHPSTADDDAVMDTSDTSTMFNDGAFDWTVRHDTGCDVMERDDSDNANHLVCHL